MNKKMKEEARGGNKAIWWGKKIAKEENIKRRIEKPGKKDTEPRGGKLRRK